MCYSDEFYNSKVSFEFNQYILGENNIQGSIHANQFDKLKQTNSP